MPVEVDENELSGLRGAQKVLSELLGSKKTKAVTHKAIKEIYPDHVVPVDGDETIAAAKEAAQAVLDKHLKTQKDENLENEFQGKLNSYRLSNKNPDGYTDEGIEKIKTLMRERTIPDVDAAVALFEKLNPAPAEPPSGYVPTGWNFGAVADEDKKQLFNDPDAWADKEARKVWDEYRKAE
jgi:hypothetical protein